MKPTKECKNVVEDTRRLYNGPADKSVLLALSLARAVLQRHRERLDKVETSPKKALKALASELTECCGAIPAFARLATRNVNSTRELKLLLTRAIAHIAFMQAELAKEDK